MRSALDRLFPDTDSVLLDGAMGTALHGQGWPSHMATVLANVEAPDMVKRVHDSHMTAGARVLLTNTFGVLLGCDDGRREVTQIAVALARDVAGSKGKIAGALAAYDIRFHGPRLDEVVTTMVSSGIDLLVFETCNEAADARAALEVARRLAPGLPTVICATTTDGSHQDFKRVTEIADVVRCEDRHGHVELGLNCCRGPSEALRLALSLQPMPRWIKPSTGLPADPVDDHVMAAFARAARLRGARFLGGCCGTTPATLNTMAGALQFT